MRNQRDAKVEISLLLIAYLITLKQNENKEEKIKNGYAEDNSPNCGMRANKGAIGIGEDRDKHMNHRQSDQAVKNILLRSRVISERGGIYRG